MALFITSLNSGSNGNCYYVGNKSEAVLIDAGISCREIEKRMNRLGLSLKIVQGIFISHEHEDHISGVETLSSKYQIPVYATKATLDNCRGKIQKSLVRHFISNEQVNIGKLTIKSFSKLHDASDPNSFIITDNENICVGVFTDIGKACSQVISHFKLCNAAFLETNYDEAMLASGNYPIYLKKRISGESGHLSNTAALELFCTYKSSNLSHLILSHLSKNNNDPIIVENLFTPYAGDTKIIIAGRYKETQVFQIEQLSKREKNNTFTNQTGTQLKMFD